MKIFNLLVGIMAAIGIFSVGCGPVRSSTTVLGLNCVGAPTSPFYCQSGGHNSLRANSNSGNNATVAGFETPGDGGGGDYYDLGDASTKCFSVPSSTNAIGTATVGLSQITGISNISSIDFGYLTVGEAVSGGSTGSANIQIPHGAGIAAINSGSSSLTLTLPLIGTATGPQSVSVVITPDNGGTLIVDNESTPQCWRKTNYRGDPHEFNAIGDGQTDDTVAMENWLSAYGNVNPTLAPTQVPPNFGPWFLTVPANYLVSAPLVCPTNANIEAGANLTGGPASSGTSSTGGSSPVRIFANEFGGLSMRTLEKTSC